MAASGFAGLGYQIVWIQQCSLWLGHESMDTTQMYLHASLELKQQALDKTSPVNGRPGRYQPDDTLLAFLKGL